MTVVLFGPIASEMREEGVGEVGVPSLYIGGC
jgi:hypothetical protein